MKIGKSNMQKVESEKKIVMGPVHQWRHKRLEHYGKDLKQEG